MAIKFIKGKDGQIHLHVCSPLNDMEMIKQKLESTKSAAGLTHVFDVFEREPTHADIEDLREFYQSLKD